MRITEYTTPLTGVLNMRQHAVQEFTLAEEMLSQLPALAHITHIVVWHTNFSYAI